MKNTLHYIIDPDNSRNVIGVLTVYSKTYGVLEYLLSLDDCLWVQRHNWSVLGEKMYAYTHINRKIKYLHNLICQTPTGLVTRHLNHNKLDNRRLNLAAGTHRDNKWDQPDFQGCYQRKSGRWYAEASIYNNKCHIGSYETKDQALAAYYAVTARVPEMAGLDVHQIRARIKEIKFTQTPTSYL